MNKLDFFDWCNDYYYDFIRAIVFGITYEQYKINLDIGTLDRKSVV